MRYLLVALCAFVNYGDSRPLSPEDLFRRAEAQRRIWNLPEAARIAARGLGVSRSEPCSEWCWRFRLLSAEILLERGETAQARPLLEGAAPTRELEARRRMNGATLEFRRAGAAHAAAEYEQARRLAAAGPPGLLSEIEIKQALILAMERRFTDAERSLQKAAARVAGRDPYLEAYAYINLGFSRMRQGRLEDAIPVLEHARRLAREGGASRRAGVLAMGNLGTCYVRLGDFDRALAHLSEAVALADEIGDKVDAKGYLGDIGNVYYRLEDYGRAIAYYRRSAALGTELGDRAWVAKMLNNLAEASLEAGDAGAAAGFNDQALEIKRRMKEPGSLAYSILNAGRIDLAARRFDAARRHFGEALAMAVAAEEPAVEWAAHGGLAAAGRSTGLPAEAEYRRAIEVVDREWSRLTRDQSRVTFLAQLIRLYQDYVDYLVEQGESERALSVAESSRARVLAEKVGRSAAQQVTPPDALRRLGEQGQTTFLAYWLAPARSYLWSIGPQGIRRFDLPAARVICGHVQDYRASLERRRDPLASGSEDGEWLYRTLVGPAADTIPRGWHVTLVPDGCLHQLNFETLPAGSRYWLQEVTLAVAPSLSVLESASARTGSEVLIIGDPPASPGFPALAGVKPEIESIRRWYPKARLYTGAEASPDTYKAASPERFEVIHFAAHATANRESPLDSAVVLAPGKGDPRLYARDVLQLPLRAELVTLSACRSAGSRSFSGEGLLGFTWAFLSAGARNVVAGLWDADDAATARLMARVYRERASGVAPADALRTAKLELLSSPDTRAPYYWGGFQVFTRVIPGIAGSPENPYSRLTAPSSRGSARRAMDAAN